MTAQAGVTQAVLPKIREARGHIVVSSLTPTAVNDALFSAVTTAR